MRPPLPGNAELTRLLGTLLDKRVRLTATKVRFKPLPATWIATYADSSGALVFAALADLAFVASVGAALALIPPAVAAESVRAGTPTASLLENAYEVFNIASAAFNEVPKTEVHVKLAGFQPFAKLVAPVPAIVTRAAVVTDFDAVVPDYPSGRLSLLTLV